MNALQEIPHRLAENAAFLWLQHKNALNSADYNLEELSELEERVDKQVKGLLIYGDEAWLACEEALAFEEDGEVFAAAVMAFSGSDGKRIKQVLDVGFSTPENFHALQSALAWNNFDAIQPILRQLLQSKDPAYLALGISCCALHRRDCGEVLVAALNNEELKAAPLYFARIVRAVGELNRKDVLPVILGFVEHDDAEVSFWSAYSAVMVGDRSSLVHLKQYVLEEGPYTDRALNILLRSLPSDNAKGLIRELSQNPELHRNLIKGLGIIGDAASLPWLLTQMEDAEHARLAGDAFAMITGINYFSQNMVFEEALEKEKASTAEDELDALEIEEDVEDSIAIDDDLVRPHVKKVAHWLKQHQSHYQSGQRYLLGKPVSVEHCMQVVKTAYQRQRLAAGIEVLVTIKDRPLGGGVYDIAKRACINA